MRMSAVKKIGKRVLQIGLPVVILALFLYQVKNNWTQLTAHTFQWNPWLLVLAFLGFMLQELSYGLIWRNILARLGSHLGLRLCLRIYLASEFVRYIPGNVWHVLTRILWVGKYDVSRPVAFASMTIELITKLAAGILVFLVAGCAFYVLLLALWPGAPLVALPICIGIYAIAWDIGFVSFITPSGLGVREAAIVGLFALALPLPAGVAAVLALLSRFVSTIAEVVCVSIAYLSGGKQVRNIQQEKQTRMLKTTGGEIQEAETASAEISTGVPVEGGLMGE